MVLAALLPMHAGNLQPPVLPTLNLTLQLDASDSSKVWQTKTVVNPAWSNPASDGDECQVWQSTIPGPTSEYTAVIETGAGTGATFKTVSPALNLSDLLFDGGNDRFNVRNRSGATNIAISSLITATGATILIVFQAHSVTTNSTPDNNDPLIINDAKRIGIVMRKATSGPDTYKIQFYNNDGGGIDVCETSVLLDTSYVACLRHDATTLYGSVNGGTEVSIASGSTVLSDAVKIGGDGTHFIGASIGEILIYNTCLAGSDLSNAINYLLGKWL